MPTVGVFQESLSDALGEVTEQSFDELCFEFGLELDDVTSEAEMAAKERGKDAAKDLSTRTIFKVDVPANRYDLLCIEGLVRALRIFKGEMKVPMYKLITPKPVANMKMTVQASVAGIRPYVVCAVLRGVTLNKDRYQSFIDLQDKLHQNIGRRRQLVSIGTHDLSTLTPPFSYEALPPQEINFVPLNQEEEMNGHRMMEVLSQHQQLKAYLPIIRDSPVYPVIYDSKRIVCSLPPIINGEHSKIRLDTKDIFIECTATDLTKCNIVVNTVVAMFSEYCTEPFTAEPVEVVYADDYPANAFTKPGQRIVYPQLDSTPMTASIDRMKTALSLHDLKQTEIRDLLLRMSVPCEVDKTDNNKLHVQIPITRSDIMHECDLVEDVAIAYGYNNLHTEIPMTFSGAAEQPINHLSDLLRSEIAGAGFTECLNWALVSEKENFAQMRHTENTEERKPVGNEFSSDLGAVHISNPKTKDFEIVRTSMLPGILKCLASNKELPLPIKLFEVGDVVVREPTREVGCKNVRRLAAVYASKKTDFGLMHGVLDQVMYSLFFEPEHEHASTSKRRTYKLVPSQDPTYFRGMQAHVVVEGMTIGIIGELHPEVLSDKGFDINFATSAFELNLEPFLEWL